MQLVISFVLKFCNISIEEKQLVKFFCFRKEKREIVSFLVLWLFENRRLFGSMQNVDFCVKLLSEVI